MWQAKNFETGFGIIKNANEPFDTSARLFAFQTAGSAKSAFSQS